MAMTEGVPAPAPLAPACILLYNTERHTKKGESDDEKTDGVCSLGGKVIKSRSAVNIVVMIAAFIAAMFMDVHVVLIILGAALAGLAASLIARAKEGTR